MATRANRISVRPPRIVPPLSAAVGAVNSRVRPYAISERERDPWGRRARSVPNDDAYAAVMKHKRKGPKQSRAGCMLCKPSKNSHNKTADRMRARRDWKRLEERAAE